MVPAVLLLVSAVVVGFLAPRILERLDPVRYDPSLLLVGWLACLAGVLAAGAASVFVLVHPTHGVSLLPTSVLSHRIGHPFAHGASTAVERLSGVTIAVVFTCAAVWIGTRIVGASRRRLRASDTHAALLRVVGRIDPLTPDLLRLDHDEPLAFCVRGSHELVVATEGVFRLGDGAAAAVIAHERAHLRGRHHTLLEWTRILGRCLWFVPLFRRAPTALAELVELTADATAARACGERVVYSALLHMAVSPAPTVGLAMSAHAIENRLARLARRDRHPHPARQWILRMVAALTGLMIPFCVTAVLLHVVFAVGVGCFGDLQHRARGLHAGPATEQQHVLAHPDRAGAPQILQSPDLVDGSGVADGAGVVPDPAALLKPQGVQEDRAQPFVGEAVVHDACDVVQPDPGVLQCPFHSVDQHGAEIAE